jgi:biotin synthase
LNTLNNNIDSILEKQVLDRQDLLVLLQTQGEARTKLFAKAAEIKRQYVGNYVYFRGLIEYSNICSKNCYYCGIRSGNVKTERYRLTGQEVLEAAQFAYREGYASLVLQSGEVNTPQFVAKITELLQQINQATDHKLGITLSLGEQTRDTYLQWREAGARRYLLRIETSNSELYGKIHPQDSKHDYNQRLDAIKLLRETGYQVGTGVMIGLPFQTLDDLAGDLLFFRDYDIDMIGMGPYIEHEDTPLYQYENRLLPLTERFDLSLKMVAILRIMMKDINIAATTAMQTIDETGREKALRVGANVMMPNLTPMKYRENYLLYQNKPCLNEDAARCKKCMEMRVHLAGDTIAYGEWGDSLHFRKRKEQGGEIKGQKD